MVSSLGHPQVLIREWELRYFGKASSDVDVIHLAIEEMKRNIADRKACSLNGNKELVKALNFLRSVLKMIERNPTDAEQYVMCLHTHFVKSKQELIKLRSSVFSKKTACKTKIEAETLEIWKKRLKEYKCKCDFC